ncbi:MAG TPA: glycosyltransferase family 2 protein [Acidimicrobiales bacterium]|nr:glycosyltransferase family 2 protein [Acidimicrobiales bacterium]
MAGAVASVVVVTHNEGAMLKATVDSFLQDTGEPLDLVVVDDASTDGSTAFLNDADYSAIRLCRLEESVGISAARNTGGRMAATDHVVFSDAHVRVHPGWLEPILESLADPAVGEVGPCVGSLGGNAVPGYGFTWKEPSLKMAWLPNPEGTADVPFLCGCFVAMRKAVFDETGGFDEGMYRWGFEDSEISLRLWLRGYRVQVAPHARIDHRFRPHFPYQVDWSGVIYNGLRLGVVHLHPQGLEVLIRHYADRPAFSRAWARLIDSDTFDRRASETGHRREGAESFLDRMGIDALR